MFTSDLHSSLAPLLARYEAGQIVVVTAHEPSHSIQWSYPTLVLESGEEHKSLEAVQRIWDFLFLHDITRRGLIICVGGGLVTDLGGFAAATYKRGMDYINIPTTLLAMVDASAGGKTGLNYAGIKNSIGAFHAPVETIICPAFLSTLPAEQMLSGFAEMLKTGLIAEDTKLWNQLLQYDLERMDIQALTPLIEACTAVKEAVVASDPCESGRRKVLNFGHTFGHALEEMQILHATPSRHPFLHGYGVLYGMIAELYLSVTLLGCEYEPLHQMTQLMLSYYGRPDCPCKDREQLLNLMEQDKKNEHAGEINCTLLKGVGQPVINRQITREQAAEALEYLLSL